MLEADGRQDLLPPMSNCPPASVTKLKLGYQSDLLVQYDQGDGGGILFASDAGQSHEHASTRRRDGQYSRQVARLMFNGSFELHPSFAAGKL